MTIIAFLAMVFVSSCSKDDDNDKISNDLVGTSWIYEDWDVIVFNTDDSFVEIMTDWGYEGEQVRYTGSYTYKKPNITLTYYDRTWDDGEAITRKGKMNGNKMTLTYEDGSSPKVYFKQ